MTEGKEKEKMDIVINRIEKLEKQVEEICKKQKMIQDAFYKIYEDNRRRERKL